MTMMVGWGCRPVPFRYRCVCVCVFVPVHVGEPAWPIFLEFLTEKAQRPSLSESFHLAEILELLGNLLSRDPSFLKD